MEARLVCQKSDISFEGAGIGARELGGGEGVVVGLGNGKGAIAPADLGIAVVCCTFALRKLLETDCWRDWSLLGS